VLHRRLLIVRTAVLILGLGLGTYYWLWGPSPRKLHVEPSTPSESAKTNSEQATSRVGSLRESTVVNGTSAAQVALPSSLVGGVTSASAPAPSRECTSDGSCRGPHHADCITAACIDGKCVYDDTNCQCATPADCEDNDPCTRNHCFLATRKCIFIPEPENCRK
jgi:hypothetical protein